MDNNTNDKMRNKSNNINVNEVRDAEKAYVVDTEEQGIDKDDKLLELYNLTQELKKEGFEPRRYMLWVQCAEEVLESYSFKDLHPYESLTARVQILYNLKRYKDVIRLIDREASPITEIPDGVHTSVNDYGSNCDELETPSILVVKALAFARLNNFDSAVKAMRKASELANPWDAHAERYGRIFKGGSDITESVYAPLPVNSHSWKAGALFETNDLNEKLIRLYAKTFSDCKTSFRYAKDFVSAEGFKPVDAHTEHIDECKQLMDQKLKHYLIPYCYARFLYAGNQYDAAEQYFDKSIEFNPNNSESYYQRAKLYEVQDRYTNAAMDYDLAISLDPEFADAYFRRGNLGLMMGNYEQAEGDFAEAASISPWLVKKISFDVLEQSISEYQKKQEETQKQEWDKVIRALSHTLKNLTASVLTPLQDYAQNEPVNAGRLQKSIRGVELIRETVNALSISFKGEPEDFVKDAQDVTRCEATHSVLGILVAALQSVVNCMFDAKYFPDFCHRYFKTRDAFQLAKKSWSALGDLPALTDLTHFIEQHMTEFAIDNAFDLSMMRLGDTHNSPMKLTFLFKELLLIAFKNACYTSRPERFIRLEFTQDNETIDFRIINVIEGNFNRSTRPGMEIVNNIVHQADGNLVAVNKDNTLTTIFTMPNIFIKQKKEKQ